MAEQISVGCSDANPRDLVQSLQRGLSVLRTFDDTHPALSLDDAAARSGVSRSAARRLLRTLMAMGYVHFDGHRYAPTPRLLDLGYAQQSRLPIVDVARPYCEELSRTLGRTVSLARIDGDDVRWILRVGVSRVMDVLVEVGTRLPAHVPAIGRVQLAWLPEDELEAFLESDTFRRRPIRAASTARDFRDELDRVRARGWCLVENELEEGLSAIAAPVHMADGRVVAGLNISTETMGRAQVGNLEQNAGALIACAERISADLHPTHLD